MSDGFHESTEVDVAVAAGELTSVVDGGRRCRVPATLSLALGANAGFGAFTPGLAKDYESSTAATVISSAGDAALSVADPSSTAPGKLVNGAFSLAQPVQAAVSGAFAPVSGSPLTLHSYSAPVSNDALTVRFKQSIGAADRCARAPTPRRSRSRCRRRRRRGIAYASPRAGARRTQALGCGRKGGDETLTAPRWRDREIPLVADFPGRAGTTISRPPSCCGPSDALAINGVPIDVLAERLDSTRGALYKTLHDARRRLRA